MLKFHDLIVGPKESLKKSLQIMTQNKKGVLFICEGEDRLVGVLTDGDIRRALLEDSLLMAPVSQAMNMDPMIAGSEREAHQKIREHSFVSIPVVQKNGRMTQIAVLDQGKIDMLLPQGNGKRHKPSSVKKSKTKVLAIIPARGGSKRIPKKNLAKISGKSLVSWAIQVAEQAKSIDAVWVSTDSKEIAKEAEKNGVPVPRFRPSRLAKDKTPTLDVLIYVLKEMMRVDGSVPEIGVLLEPTAPLRQADMIDQAVRLLKKSKADSVVSVSEVPHVLNPEELLVIEKKKLKPYVKTRKMDYRRLRGKQSKAYVQNGLVIAFRVKSLLKKKRLYGDQTLPLLTEWASFFDIDTPEDLRLGDSKMRRRNL